MSTGIQLSLREALEARKAEIEAALEELERLEALAGLRPPLPPQVNGKSYSQAVLDSITTLPKSRAELCDELGLSEEQVHHALTSHRLRKIVRSRREHGRIIYFVGEPKKPEPGEQRLPSITDGILELLPSYGGALSGAEIATMLEGRVQSSAANFQASVASTLSSLVRAGRIEKDIEGGYVAIDEDDE